MALTTAGRGWVIDKIQSVAPASNANMDQIGWGTSSTAEAVGDTDLGTVAAPTNTTRVTGTLSQPAATTDRLTGTVTATGSLTIAEVGRFNTNAVGGGGQILQQRHVFTGIPLLSGDAIAFTLDLTD